MQLRLNQQLQIRFLMNFYSKKQTNYSFYWPTLLYPDSNSLKYLVNPNIFSIFPNGLKLIHIPILHVHALLSELKMIFAGILVWQNTIDSIHVHALELHLINIFINDTTMNVLIWVYHIVVVNTFQESSLSIASILETM